MSPHRIRNWPDYNAGLKQRGSLTFWIEPEILVNWEVKEKTGLPGASCTYSHQAIVTMVSLKSVFGLPGRALCGFVESIFQLMQVDLSVPDHTTISRRLRYLEVTLPVVPGSSELLVKPKNCLISSALGLPSASHDEALGQ